MEAARGVSEVLRNPAVAATLEAMRSPAVTEALATARAITADSRVQDAARQAQSAPVKQAIEALRANQALVSNDPLGVLRDASAELEGPVSFQQLKKRAHIAEAARIEPRPSARRDRFVQGSLANTTLVTPTSGAGLDLVAGVEDIGALVRKARKARGISQQDLALRAGVGRRFVSELENGKPTLEFERVIQVTRAAGVDLFAKTSV